MIGTTLARYQIIEKLGEGGMGVVYKARDNQLDRFVAIKVLPREKLTSPDRKLRFIQEAKAASALNHPNIISIYEIGNQEGIDFISTEFIAGARSITSSPGPCLLFRELMLMLVKAYLDSYHVAASYRASPKAGVAAGGLRYRRFTFPVAASRMSTWCTSSTLPSTRSRLLRAEL
jgi:hypothetical protein